MKHKITTLTMLALLCAMQGGRTMAKELAAGQEAPTFSLKTHAGETFAPEDRRGKGWTVLYFYPKADTPGCTKQACAFRDAIDDIRALNVEIYGISSDSMEELAEFHKKYNLKFALLADDQADVIKAYGTKMPLVGLSKRWTFIIDTSLVIRHIEKGVDPVKDAARVAERIKELQQK